jgi:serine/threonine protein kinase
VAKVSAQVEKLGWKLLGTNLGKGGQGDVELVERLSEPGGQRYALKILGERGGQRAYDRFRQELDALRKVDHPGIVKVIEYAQDPADLQYYVMEYVEGAKSLRRRMERKENPFFSNPVKAVDGFIQIVEALAECEKVGIVHRDLSPANVLVTEGGQVLLIDFGLCYIEDGQRLTLTEEAVGTPHYRPPECSGYSSTPATIKADLYSAGKILWSMITNRTAFDRERPVFNDLALDRVLPDHVMAWHLHHIFEKTIRHDPSNRYQSTGKALSGARRVRRLIIDGFKPLEVLAEGLCPMCGVGRCQRPPQTVYTDDVDKYYQRLGQLRDACWTCPYCYHVTFVVDAAQKKFLASRKELE